MAYERMIRVFSENGESFGLSTRCGGQNSYLAHLCTAHGSFMPRRLCLWATVTSKSGLQTTFLLRFSSVWHLSIETVNNLTKEEKSSNCSRLNIVKYYSKNSEIHATDILMYKSSLLPGY